MTDVLIHCQEADTTAVDGVLIRIYDTDDTFITEGTSGDGANPAGDRLFDLPSPKVLLTSSVAAASIITTSLAHELSNGQTVLIAGHVGSVPDINGTHVVTVLSPTTFSIPVTVTTGGTLGSVVLNSARTGYTMRLSMSVSGYSFTLGAPQSFAPTGVVAADIFDVEVNLHARDTATDGNLCRCSGYFRDLRGTAFARWGFMLRNMNNPLLLGEDAIVGSSVRIVTDAAGFASVDLVRDAVYRVYAEGLLDINLEIRIPNASSANLPDVLFPIVSAVTWTPTAVTVATGATSTLAATVDYLSGLQVPVEDFDPDSPLPVAFVVDDPDVATVAVSNTGFVVTGISAGTATVTVTRHVTDEDDSIIRFPAPAALTSSLVITVT